MKEVVLRKFPKNEEYEVSSDGKVFHRGVELPIKFSKYGSTAYVSIKSNDSAYGSYQTTSLASILHSTFMPDMVGTAKYCEVRPVSLGIDNLRVIPPKEKELEEGCADGMKSPLDTYLNDTKEWFGRHSLTRESAHECVDQWFDRHESEIPRKRKLSEILKDRRMNSR